MAFVQSELAFEPGLFSNRSARASRRRWVDGDLVRFRDGVPCQMGGWRRLTFTGATIDGRARAMISWRPNSQYSRYAVIGTHKGAFLYDGGSLVDVTPTGMTDGRESSVIGNGFGVGLFGRGTFGTPRTLGGTLVAASTWSFDMFGETLIACFSDDGVISEFNPASDAQLTPIAGAPTARCVCVSHERHVFAFGCDGNPRLVQWSDREDYSVWTPSSTNRAGSYEMQARSPFITARRVRGQVLAWTETEVFAFFPLNNALVYGRETLDETAGAAGPLSVCVATERGGETAYWWGTDSFYIYDGFVRRMACDLQDYVFNDVNLLQRAKFEAATNVEFSEIRFSYCSAASDEIDRCVVFCYANQTWTKANVARLAWMDRKIFEKPLAVDASGNLFEHEVGDTADGDPIDSFVLSHPIMIGFGESFAEISTFWPDMQPTGEGAALTIIARDYAGAPDQVFGPYEFGLTTEKVDLNISARQFQVKISGIGTFWEIGSPLISVQGGSLK